MELGRGVTAAGLMMMAASLAACSSTSREVAEARDTLTVELCDYGQAHPPGNVAHIDASGNGARGDIADSETANAKFWLSVLATPAGDSVFSSKMGQCPMVMPINGIYMTTMVPCEQGSSVGMQSVYGIGRVPAPDAATGMQEGMLLLAANIALDVCRDRAAAFVRTIPNASVDEADLVCEVRAQELCNYNNY